jgi:hypothetical protein
MFGPSRPVYAGVFRFLLVTLLALVLLAGTIFLIASLLAYVRGEPWDRPIPFTSGLGCGLLIWLIIAIFHLRKATLRLPISQGNAFLGRAKTILREMGYAIASERPDRLIVRPRFHSFLFGGSIQITVEGHVAKLTGPTVSLDIFRRRYRLQSHVQRVQQVLQDQRKFTENLVKRVELRLRLKPEQFDRVRRNVIALLQEDGTVICELNILVQSEKGVREDTVEFQIREWLELHEIPYSIHKDLVQFTEVVHPESEAVSLS